MFRFGRGPESGVSPKVVDVLAAALCAALALASLVGRISPTSFEEGPIVHFKPADALGVSLVLLGTVPLLLRRRHPIAVLVVAGVSLSLVQALGYASPPLPAAEFVILYTMASMMSTIVSAVAAGMIALSIVGSDLIHDATLNDDKLLAYLLSILGAWVFGYLVKVSRTQAAIAQENVRLLTQHQEAMTQLAVRQEQERISREMHDVIAHSVGVMVAQASSARLVFSKQPEYARGALNSIESTGRAALAEMRALFRVLHGDAEEGDAQECAEPAPPATLAGLPLLLERIEAAGLPVDLQTGGTPRPLPPSVDMAAYRIVQESLTNCLRHAGPAHATVRIGYQAERLDVQVCDDGRRRPGGNPGRGLLGMRQRVTLLGGEFTAGRMSTGYQVWAMLPLPQEQPCPSES